ncbi:MAG: trigger factor [Lachnospiraceae bacterium]|nr:trigger factor [Lachnospiraceae bacterium]
MNRKIIKTAVPVLLMLFLSAGCGSRMKALDYIELGQYKGIPVSRMSTTVSEEDLQKQMDQLERSYATLESVTDRDTVEQGDVANIDYAGSIDGVAFDGGTAQGFDLEIGSGVFIPGFEDGLVGAKVGETRDVNVTFPDDYMNNPDLSGKPAVFTVTVNSIGHYVVPEMTDEFIEAKTEGQFHSLDEVRQFLKEQTEASLTAYAESNMYSQLLGQAVANATLKKDIPADFLEEKKDSMIRTAKSNAEAYGKSYEDYLRDYLQMDEATFEETIKISAESIAKQNLVISAIAEVEGITVSDEEYDKEVADMIAEYGFASEDDLLESMTKQDIKDAILLDKVQAFLAENAEITQQ